MNLHFVIVIPTILFVATTGFSRADTEQATPSRIEDTPTSTHHCREALRKSYPFASSSNLARTLCGSFPAPPGYERVKTEEGSFADWLRQLPLRPAGTLPRYCSGELAGWTTRQAAAVIDMDLIGEIQDCATSVVRLWAEYLVNHGKERALSVKMNQKKSYSWSAFMRGCRPSYDRSTRKLTVSCGHGRPSASTARARAASIMKYVRRAMQYTNSATLARHLRRTTKTEAGPGTVILQPNPSGGTGHASIIADMALDASGNRLYIVANGFLPAQDMFIVGPDRSPADRLPWCTLEEFEASMSGLGPNYVYAVFE